MYPVPTHFPEVARKENDHFLFAVGLSGGGIFHTLIATEDYGSRVLVEQAVHEMKRGANDVALSYIEKALAVRATMKTEGVSLSPKNYFIICLLLIPLAL